MTALPFRRQFRGGNNAGWDKAQGGPICFLCWRGPRFVIFRIAVDLPQIVKLRVSQNIFRAQHCCHHRVILIVVLVHAVTTNQVQVWVAGLQFFANGRDVARIVVIVNRVGFLLTNNTTIDEIAFFGQARSE